MTHCGHRGNIHLCYPSPPFALIDLLYNICLAPNNRKKYGTTSYMLRLLLILRSSLKCRIGKPVTFNKLEPPLVCYMVDRPCVHKGHVTLTWSYFRGYNFTQFQCPSTLLLLGVQNRLRNPK